MMPWYKYLEIQWTDMKYFPWSNAGPYDVMLSVTIQRTLGGPSWDSNRGLESWEVGQLWGGN